MATKRHKPEEIVKKLRQFEVLVGQGKARVDATREVRITEQTYYRRLWLNEGSCVRLQPEHRNHVWSEPLDRHWSERQWRKTSCFAGRTTGRCSGR
jgi:hypothetical protein